MADGCDDPQQIDQLARLVERGVVVAAASRYMRGGQQVGGPSLKSAAVADWPGCSLHCWPGSAPTTPPTRSRPTPSGFVREVGIESDAGFEMGIELVAKARRLRRPVAEIPTIWLDRQLRRVATSRWRKWLPRYLRWYFFAFGPRLTLEQLRSALRPPNGDHEQCT